MSRDEKPTTPSIEQREFDEKMHKTYLNKIADSVYNGANIYDALLSVAKWQFNRNQKELDDCRAELAVQTDRVKNNHRICCETQDKLAQTQEKLAERESQLIATDHAHGVYMDMFEREKTKLAQSEKRVLELQATLKHDVDKIEAGYADDLAASQKRERIMRETLEKIVCGWDHAHRKLETKLAQSEKREKLMREALQSVRHALVGHKGNGEILTEIDEALKAAGELK